MSSVIFQDKPYHTRYLNFTPEGYVDYSYVNLNSNKPHNKPYEFEIIEWKKVIHFMHRYWFIPYLTGVLYVLIIFGLQIYLRNRKGFELKRVLFWWNAALGFFSILGFIRLAPEFLEKIWDKNGGIHSAICVWKSINVQSAFWLLLFVFSKFIELGDTLFIVLRKKPLVFLQWYHHLLSLIACWTVAPYIEPINTFYAVMNFGIHSLMYPYFALKALDIYIPRKVANIITTLQLCQMVAAFLANGITSYLYYSGAYCHRHPVTMKLALFGYGTFALLFLDLWQKSVLNSRKKRLD